MIKISYADFYRDPCRHSLLSTSKATYHEFRTALSWVVLKFSLRCVYVGIHIYIYTHTHESR